MELDTLMDRIRQKVREQKAASNGQTAFHVAGAPSQGEGINEAVSAQAEFNQTFVRTLELIVRELEGLDAGFTSLGERLGESTNSSSDRYGHAVEEINRLYKYFDEVNKDAQGLFKSFSELEQKLNRGLREVAQNIQEALALNESRDAEEVRRLKGEQQTTREQLARLLRAVETLEKKNDDLNERQGALEQRLDESVRNQVRATFGALEQRLADGEGRIAELGERTDGQLSRLDEAVADVRRKVDAGDHKVSDFEQKLDGQRQELSGRLSSGLSALEERARDSARRAEDLRAELLALDSKVGDGLAVLAGVDQKIGDSAAEVSRGYLTKCAEIESRLREEMALFTQPNSKGDEKLDAVLAKYDEVSRRVDASDSYSMVLEEKITQARDELKIRLLRTERAVRGLVVGPAGKASDAGVSEAVSAPQFPAGGEKVAAHARAGHSNVGTRPDQPFDYFIFEHGNRGSVVDIKRRQAKYLELFSGRESVIDLGCGRGEFVELLSENGVKVRGVDMNLDMVEFSRDRGLDVIQADIFGYLEGLPDASVDGVFSAQVVEHLTPEMILRLTRLCGQKVKPRGVIVLETVNVNCPEALGNFYLDPTHVRPVPAKMLRFLLEQGGFKFRSWKFSGPVSGAHVAEALDVSADLPKEIEFYQDYAAVAVKR